MEPITSSGAAPTARTPGGATDATALLREGRVLRAEVLAGGTDGTLMLAIGRQTIPAESDLDLDPGTRFLVRVLREGDGIVLEQLAGDDGDEGALLRALRATFGDRAPLGESLGDLARALRGGGEFPAPLRTLALALGAALVAPDGDAESLRTLLDFLGAGHEAALARASRDDLPRLRGDLKAHLLRALRVLEGRAASTGELRPALERALASIESEQLLNAARERSGDAPVLSFPVPDGEGFATVFLTVDPESQAERERSGEEAAFRLSLGVELRQLGPLRADVVLAPGRLKVRLVVTRADVARRIEAGFEELRTRLAGARAVELHVRVGTEAEAAAGLRTLDTRYLREHHLMDLAG